MLKMMGPRTYPSGKPWSVIMGGEEWFSMDI